MSARPRFRWLRRIAATVLAVLLALMLALAWLLATTSGARFALGRAQGLAPGELIIGRVDGTLLGTLRIEGLDYTYGATRVAVGRLALQVAPGVLINFRRLTVRDLQLDGVTLRYAAAPPDDEPEVSPITVPELVFPGLPVAVDVRRFEATDVAFGPAGAPPQRIDRVTLVARLAGRTLDVSSLAVEAPAGRVGLAGRADLGRRLALDVAADWLLREGRGASGRLSLAGDRQGYRLRHDLAAPFEILSEGSVQLPVDDEPRFRLEHRAAAFEVALGERVLAFGDVGVETAGRYSEWRVQGRADLTDATLGDAAIALTATGNGADAEIERLELMRDAGGRLSASGAIGGWPDARWQARLDTREAPLALASLDVDATIDAVVTAVGGLGAAPFVDASVESLTGRWRDVTLDATGALAWRPGAVDFDTVRVAVGANRARIDGRVATDAGADIDLEFEIDAPDLAQVAPDLAGRLEAAGRAAGPARAPAADARFELTALRAAGVAVDTASGTLDLSAGELRFSLDARASRVEAGALHLDDVAISARGTPEAHTLALSVQGQRVPEARLEANGAVVDNGWQGRVNALDVALQRAAGPLRFALADPFDVALAPGAVRVSTACIAAEPAPRLCARAAIDAEAIDLRADLEGLSLAEWTDGLGYGMAWTGQADASVEIEGPRERLSGTARLDVAGLTATREGEAGPATVAFDAAQARATLDAGVLDTSARLAIEGGGVADATIGFGDVYSGGGALTGRVALAIPDVTAANAFVDNVRFSGGEFRAEAQLGGTRAAPVVTSRIDASDLRARLLPLGIEIADVRVEADNENSDVLRFSGSGSSGEGRFELVGETALARDAEFATRATVRADRFTFLDLPDRQAVASMDLEIAADTTRQSLSGTLTVDRADINVQSLPESAVRVSPDVVRVDAAPDETSAAAARRIERRMDVTINLSDAVRLEAFGLRGRIEGAMDLRKREAAPVQGFGALDVRDGVYKAYGQSLEVTRGRLVFNGPLDAPVLDVRAERQVADKRVGIEIAGTPDALESSLFSEPPLPEAEAFSLLITGRSLASAGQAGDTPLGDIALALGLREAFAVGSAVRDVVGLDTLTLEGGGRDGRVLAGKQLSPQLYLEYAYGVFDQVSSVLLRLQITDKLALESTSGQAQSVDIVYSVGAR